VEVVASLSQGRTAAAQCGLFTHKSVPVIFEPPCITVLLSSFSNQFRTKDDQKRPKTFQHDTPRGGKNGGRGEYQCSNLCCAHNYKYAPEKIMLTFYRLKTTSSSLHSHQ